MDKNNLKLLKQVLPSYLMLDEVHGRIYDADTEEQFLIMPEMSCGDVLTALLERARATGKLEGRVDVQYELRKTLGIEPDLTETMHYLAEVNRRLVRIENRK